MKNLRRALSIVLSLMMIFSAFAVVANAEECEHNYSATSVAPTCVEDGYILYVCTSCGHNYKDYNTSVGALGHNYGDWNTLEEASCEAEGHAQRDCLRCGASEVKTLSILEHIDSDYDGECDRCAAEVEVETTVSPFDWLVAFFNALIQWFRDIFA